MLMYYSNRFFLIDGTDITTIITPFTKSVRLSLDSNPVSFLSVQLH